MSWIESLAKYVPEIVRPKEKNLGFKRKMYWTLGVLFAFFVLGVIPLWGLDPASQFEFAQLELILGASFGSIISLGIGPIVTASIVLQLLKGSGILDIDTHTDAGKKKFQAIQQVLTVVFVVFEAFIFVYMGGLAPPSGVPNFQVMQLLLVFQLIIGGMLILFMDQVTSKWGFGSGVGLFIAAGVGKELFVRTFSPLSPSVEGIQGEGYIGAVPDLIFRAIPQGEMLAATTLLAAIIATIVIFLVVVFTQAMKVEIPLSFGRVRGHGIRWPLNFFYTSNIPVILVAALLANMQLWARLMQGWAERTLEAIGEGAATFGQNMIITVSRWLGHVGEQGQPIPFQDTLGFIGYITPPNMLEGFITGSVTGQMWAAAGVYTLFMVAGSVLFSYFWVQTAGLDSRSQAKNIMASGLQVPGFRKDPRVMERLLDRYVMPLTIMGGIAVGLLAAIADLSGTLTSGIGLLLAVMILYRMYQDIAKEQAYEMNPMMRRFFGKE